MIASDAIASILDRMAGLVNSDENAKGIEQPTTLPGTGASKARSRITERIESSMGKTKFGHGKSLFIMKESSEDGG